jgi:hypothetical protein
MTTHTKFWLATGLTAALLGVAGCSDSSNDNNTQGGATTPATVPDSAGTTVASFIAYLIGLDANDEKSEPLLIKDGFAVPADEANDPGPIV